MLEPLSYGTLAVGNLPSTDQAPEVRSTHGCRDASPLKVMTLRVFTLCNVPALDLWTDTRGQADVRRPERRPRRGPQYPAARANEFKSKERAHEVQQV